MLENKEPHDKTSRTNEEDDEVDDNGEDDKDDEDNDDGENKLMITYSYIMQDSLFLWVLPIRLSLKASVAQNAHL